MRVPTQRWVRLVGGGTLVLAIVAFGVRSLVLPARSAFVFLDYSETASWQPAPKNPLFASGELAFAAREPIQLGGEDLGSWDEVVIVDFADADDFDAFVEAIAAEDALSRYHLMEASPGPPELLYFLNLRLQSDRGDPSIDPGEAAPLEEVVPDAQFVERWRALFSGPHRGPIVLLNLLTDREAQANASADDASPDELHERYEQKALRVLGMLGAQISVTGTVDRVVVGPALRHYDRYGFASYPSVDAFEVMATSRERLDARVHRDAALEAEDSAGYWAKPYPAFIPDAP